MKRQAVQLADLANRSNLILAVHKAAKGKRHRPAVAEFIAALDGNLNLLAARILAGSAPEGVSHRFVIHDPKRRTITAACFADRVLHHAILNLTEGQFERHLVPSCFACRPGLGVHAAVLAVQRNLQRFTWVAQVDVAGYFPSIDHVRLKGLLARRFKGADFLALLGRIIDCGGASFGRPICAPLSPLRGDKGTLEAKQRVKQGIRGACAVPAERLPDAAGSATCKVRVRDFSKHRQSMMLPFAARGRAERTLRMARDATPHPSPLPRERGLNRRSLMGQHDCGMRRNCVNSWSVWDFGIKKLSCLVRFSGTRKARNPSHSGSATDQEIQRASDAALAALAHTQTLHFRQRLWLARGA